jgi:hypothetical protein
MKLHLFKIQTLTICLTFFYFFSYSQSVRHAANQKEGSYNTTIIVNFKKDADRAYTTFQMLNPLFFEPAILSGPSNKVDTSNKLRTIIKVNLKKPTYLALGYSVFYIEPRDSVNMNYETIAATRTQFKDTITINHGNVFFIFNNGGSPILEPILHQVYKKLESLKSANLIIDCLSAERLSRLTENFTKSVYKQYPQLNRSDAMFQKVRTICSNNFYRQLVFRLKYLYKNTTDKGLKDAIQQSITKMLTHTGTQKNEVDAISLGKYSTMYLFYKEMNLDESAIRAKFDVCNDTIKQYILINLLKDGLLVNNHNKETILGKITYPPFKAFAIKNYQNPNRGIEKMGYINNMMRNAKIFDTNDKQIIFADLFKTTKQPFIIFDFCGSWCKPCLNEIAIYNQTKNLDSAKLIRPIWLFFENDKKKWTDVITQNNLNPQNCFVIIENESQLLKKEFALSFDWQGEFPHHFVFSKEGKIIEKNAKNLSAFSESDLPLPLKTPGKNLSIPPPLPGIRRLQH